MSTHKKSNDYNKEMNGRGNGREEMNGHGNDHEISRKRKNGHDDLDGNYGQAINGRENGSVHVHGNDHEVSRRRMNGHDLLDHVIKGSSGVENGEDEEEENNHNLDLTLGTPSTTPSPPEPGVAVQAKPALPVQRTVLHHEAVSGRQYIGQTPPVQIPLRLAASHPLYGAHHHYAPQHPPGHSPVPPPLPPQQLYPPETTLSRPPRGRRNPTQVPREGKSETVAAPFPWATNRRATVHSLPHLLANSIFTISGAVQCKRCERQDEMSFNLEEKFNEIGRFIFANKSRMHDRAPSTWMNPTLPTCKVCKHENSLKPIIAEKKKAINWLFLLLGQLLGCCTLEQLKYFCKHTKNHRTGAKDRVLYLTYLGLCKQLDPDGPFDRS